MLKENRYYWINDSDIQFHGKADRNREDNLFAQWSKGLSMGFSISQSFAIIFFLPPFGVYFPHFCWVGRFMRELFVPVQGIVLTSSNLFHIIHECQLPGPFWLSRRFTSQVQAQHPTKSLPSAPNLSKSPQFSPSDNDIQLLRPTPLNRHDPGWVYAVS